ncbi:MAPEG family protein [Rhodobacteraceae bacterium 2376]|uniref:MAPEG family protein n=1 Tax=Rhabdonatronobacter sediminivivens TaxID=2743469 RepID=A0A7Z0L0J9_9RHOB|nr:MAPEG family protein [Rhabdonatronobacter sediminivivens]NYS26271.1 MAPEG family protein [Rhabdonatronobacter sediminivivens]
MTPELTALTLALLLQVVQYVLLSVTANLQLGTRYTTSPRDEHKPLTGIPARLLRALNNHFEALILFTPAVLIVTLTGQSSAFTVACAWAYLGARALYIPAYAFGWVPGRSIIWAVGFFATLAMLLSALF